MQNEFAVQTKIFVRHLPGRRLFTIVPCLLREEQSTAF